MKAALITFEGIDFCGKSAQIEQLIQKLEKKRIDYLLLREPGGTVFAEKIRSVLLTKENETMDPTTEYLLYSAARAQLTRNRIIPALKAGQLVICDRFFDSSTAYQGYGRGIDLDFIHQINKFATAGINPDLTILIDIDLKEMECRKQKLSKQLDRMEDQKSNFFRQVRSGYLTIARQEPERFRVLNGKRTVSAIAEEVWQQVQAFL
ncbi:MAG TPA: dTMP kinase [bacterium]|nr:dTMP kinase [bacterium]